MYFLGIMFWRYSLDIIFYDSEFLQNQISDIWIEKYF